LIQPEVDTPPGGRYSRRARIHLCDRLDEWRRNAYL